MDDQWTSDSTEQDQPAEGGEVTDAGPGAEQGEPSHTPSEEQAAENRENDPPA